MIHSRRGLSDIVTNVLIILLVLVAVGIVWYFVQPFIRGSVEGVEGAQDCLTIDIAPISCVANGITDAWNVTVNRNSGAGGLQGVKLVFADSSGNTKVATHTISLAEFESVKLNSTLTSFAPSSVKVAAVVSVSSDPNGRSCDIKPTQVPCN